MEEATVHTGESGAPTNRMIIAVLALIGVLMSLYLTLHKLGYVGALACGTGACEVVQTSKWAVQFGVPVPVFGLLGYALMLAVAVAGLQPRGSSDRIFSIMIFVLADIAFLFTLYLSYLEQFVIHAWCRWCIGSAAVATAIWICSLVELLRLQRTR